MIFNLKSKYDAECALSLFNVYKNLGKTIDLDLRKEETTDKVYEFWYNDCIYESAAACMSLHRTKKGAEMALEFHKAEELKKWNEFDKWQREQFGNKYEILKGSPFGIGKAWGITDRKIIE